MAVYNSRLIVLDAMRKSLQSAAVCQAALTRVLSQSKTTLWSAGAMFLGDGPDVNQVAIHLDVELGEFGREIKHNFLLLCEF